ncbi:MAG: FYVE zinc finger domain-containing protein [Melioribacteraceae bacterium]|nr:FYVE zinc finger domain-containing protein [Melioribacteraceae bacterium]
MSKSTHCSICEKKFGIFRWRNNCSICEDIVCSDHYKIWSTPDFSYFIGKYPPQKSTKGKVCDNCGKAFIDKIKKMNLEFYKKYENANQNMDKVEIKIFPETYKGNVRADEKIKQFKVKSHFFKKRDDSLRQLKFACLIYDLDLIYDLKYVKKTFSEDVSKPFQKHGGIYYYTKWKAKATLAKRIK